MSRLLSVSASADALGFGDCGGVDWLEERFDEVGGLLFDLCSLWSEGPVGAAVRGSSSSGGDQGPDSLELVAEVSGIVKNGLACAAPLLDDCFLNPTLSGGCND
jgi:hypothetical protein